MRAAYPVASEEADDEVREDGIACHWLAAEIHAGHIPKLNSLSPNNRVLTEEMFDACDEYLGVINSWSAVGPFVEESIDCSVIVEGMSGTPDAWAFNAVTRTLYIADLKFGFRFVEVWENWQLVCYIAAILEKLNISGLEDQHITVHATIVQPRSFHRDGTVRTWTVKASDLRAQINVLRSAAAKAIAPNPECTPNSGCGDCPARHACTALQNSALRALETAYAGIPLELSPAAVGDELRRLKDAAKKLDARITGLESQAEALLRAGKVVPWWSLESSYGRERWRDGVEDYVLTLGRLYKQDLAKPLQPISPTQARKLLPAELVAAYAHKPSTGVRLTKLDPFAAKKKFQQPTE
jgi:hypothetical protein